MTLSIGNLIFFFAYLLGFMIYSISTENLFWTPAVIVYKPIQTVLETFAYLKKLPLQHLESYAKKHPILCGGAVALTAFAIYSYAFKEKQENTLIPQISEMPQISFSQKSWETSEGAAKRLFVDGAHCFVLRHNGTLEKRSLTDGEIKSTNKLTGISDSQIFSSPRLIYSTENLVKLYNIEENTLFSIPRTIKYEPFVSCAIGNHLIVIRTNAGQLCAYDFHGKAFRILDDKTKLVSCYVVNKDTLFYWIKNELFAIDLNSQPFFNEVFKKTRVFTGLKGYVVRCLMQSGDKLFFSTYQAPQVPIAPEIEANLLYAQDLYFFDPVFKTCKRFAKAGILVQVKETNNQFLALKNHRKENAIVSTIYFLDSEGNSLGEFVFTHCIECFDVRENWMAITEKNHIQLWDLKAKKCIKTVDTKENITEIVLNEDSIIAAESSGTIQVLKLL